MGYTLLHPTEIPGEGVHRDGWPYVVQSIALSSQPSGLLLDHFIEHSFLYKPMPHPYSKPWFGIVHHPHDIPEWLAEANRLQNIFKTALWQDSLPFCKGLITFSPGNAYYLSKTFEGLPINCTPHPAKLVADRCKFSFDKWLLSDTKTLLQVGSFLRNTRIIDQLHELGPGWMKLKLLPSRPWIRGYDAAVQRYFKVEKLLDRSYKSSEPVMVMDRLSDDSYDAMLASNIVLTEIFAASANNVVLDCLVRGTPLVVNRLPAVEYYLGEDYPLYFTYPCDVSRLVNDYELVRRTHNYLRLRLEYLIAKKSINVQDFVSNLTRFAGAIA